MICNTRFTEILFEGLCWIAYKCCAQRLGESCHVFALSLVFRQQIETEGRKRRLLGSKRRRGAEQTKILCTIEDERAMPFALHHISEAMFDYKTIQYHHGDRNCYCRVYLIELMLLIRGIIPLKS